MHPSVQGIVDDALQVAIEQIVDDKDYIKENHKEPWSTIVSKVNKLISAIVEKVFLANTNYIYKNPLDANEESIRDFIKRLNEKLSDDFDTSPPFTIHHLINTLTLSTPGFQLPPSQTSNPEIKHKLSSQNFRTTIRNMMSKEETIVESVNKYYQKSSEDSSLETPNSRSNSSKKVIKKRVNETYAIKFLRSLERSIFVQSSIDEINLDLKSYGSENTTLHKSTDETTLGGDTNDGFGTRNNGPMHMVKIDWIDERSDKPRRGSEDISAEEEERELRPEQEPEVSSNPKEDDDYEQTGRSDENLIDNESPKRSSISYNDQGRILKRTKSISNIKDEIKDEEMKSMEDMKEKLEHEESEKVNDLPVGDPESIRGSSTPNPVEDEVIPDVPVSNVSAGNGDGECNMSID